jgi:hypothetical protein
VIGVYVWGEVLLLALLAVAPGYLLIGVVFALMSMTVPIYNVVQFSYRLALIPDALQGRVNSTFRLLAFGFMPLGAALSGWVIERFGVLHAVAAFTLWLAVLAVATTLNRHVRDAPPIGQVVAK